MENNSEKIIISLGGSLIIPEELDIEFLKSFKDLILAQVAKGKKFVIITGGGKLARKYQNAGKEISNASNADLDLIGIKSLNLNAELLRVIFGEYACEKVLYVREEKFDFNKPVMIFGAEKPGSSTDLGAVWLAKNSGAKKVINLSNTDYVYDSDPRINPNAKKFDKISWTDYRNLIPKEWNPGLSSPFDPIASEMADKEGMQVMIINGKPIDNFAKCLNNESFAGTLIS